MSDYLAVDIGASSGRHILGRLEDGKLTLREIYRFENAPVYGKDGLTWDIQSLVFHVKEGLRRCGAEGIRPKSVAIDTWGVDYVLTDEKGRALEPVYCYRNDRTDEAVPAVERLLPQEALYRSTGIQKQKFNTLYQLWCDRKTGKLDRAAHVLMIPDYLAFTLCGKMANEYTDSSTTGILRAREKDRDPAILAALGIPETLFFAPSLPGTALGNLTPEVRKEVDFDTAVVLAPSHDTAAAVAAIPLSDAGVFLSSGTWSLIGAETREPILTDAAREANFTNEGGVEYRFRFLKNLMGMWLLQSIRKNIGKTLSYDEMEQLAAGSAYRKTFDPNDPSLMAPEDMIASIRNLLGEPELPLADVIAAVYHSLAGSYARAVREIETITKKTVAEIVIVGGGSKDKFLNSLTAKATGKRIVTGLTEATATGNLLAQIMADRKISLAEARAIVRSSVSFKEVTL